MDQFSVMNRGKIQVSDGKNREDIYTDARAANFVDGNDSEAHS